MKNKLLILLLLSFIFISGCGKKDNEEKLDDDTVILENIKYKLDTEDNEYGLKYKIASNFRKSVMINAVNYFSEDIDGSPYFVIRIYYYKNKTLDYAIKDSVEDYESKTEKTVNGVDYTVVHFINYNKAETNLYYYVNGKDVYVFVFTSGIDLSRLEEIFLKNVIYP